MNAHDFGFQNKRKNKEKTTKQAHKQHSYQQTNKQTNKQSINQIIMQLSNYTIFKQNNPHRMLLPFCYSDINVGQTRPNFPFWSLLFHITHYTNGLANHILIESRIAIISDPKSISASLRCFNT